MPVDQHYDVRNPKLWIQDSLINTSKYFRNWKIMFQGGEGLILGLKRVGEAQAKRRQGFGSIIMLGKVRSGKEQNIRDGHR